jgi:hypothetical protein
VTLTTFATAAAPISLDDLVASAGLQTRLDRKYLLTAADLDVVTDRLAGEPDRGLAVLDIAGRRTFGYRSTYFDTPDLRAYRSAGRGRRRRFKVRTREYLDTGTTWLEVKTRGPRGSTIKQRVPHLGDPRRLGTAGTDAVALLLAGQGITDVAVATLSATLATTYRRTTLHVPGTGDRPDTRATIDTDLSWHALPHGIRVDRPDLVIVETKGVPAPSPLDRVLWRAGHRPRSVSKYGAGLAALRTDLPPLKWHRVVAGLLAA